MQFIRELIEKRDWINAIVFVREINTATIDVWDRWAELAKAIKPILSSSELAKLSDIQPIAKFLSRIRYEPDLHNDRVYLERVKRVVEESRCSDVVPLVQYLVHYPLQMLEKHKEEIEAEVVKKVK
jgi:hypothetical protein